MFAVPMDIGGMEPVCFLCMQAFMASAPSLSDAEIEAINDRTSDVPMDAAVGAHSGHGSR